MTLRTLIDLLQAAEKIVGEQAVVNYYITAHTTRPDAKPGDVWITSMGRNADGSGYVNLEEYRPR